MEMKDIVKIAVDAHKGAVGNYSLTDSQAVLREEAIALNGGSTKLDIRAIRDGECKGLFRLIEEILSATVADDIANDAFFNKMVETRNVALGDSLDFVAPEEALFYVANTASGTQGVRRQRLNAGASVTLKPVLKTIKFYEELDRVLAGRVDFNQMIDLASRSFKKDILDAAYTAVANLANGSTYFPTAGSYNEGALIELIDHLEAKTGMKATIWGTRSALRNLEMTNMADSAKEDQYALGYFGKFYGTDVVCTPQVHATNTDTFKLNDKQILITAGDSKPIKHVTEGDTLLIPGNPLSNADLTQDYLLGMRYAVGLIDAGKVAAYTLA